MQDAGANAVWEERGTRAVLQIKNKRQGTVNTRNDTEGKSKEDKEEEGRREKEEGKRKAEPANIRAH